jgi:hypothetical protein
MWQFYASIAVGGVLLMTAPPNDVKDKGIAPAVAFLLVWPVYLLLDIAQQYLSNRRR